MHSAKFRKAVKFCGFTSAPKSNQKPAKINTQKIIKIVENLKLI